MKQLWLTVYNFVNLEEKPWIYTFPLLVSGWTFCKETISNWKQVNETLQMINKQFSLFLVKPMSD